MHHIVVMSSNYNATLVVILLFFSLSLAYETRLSKFLVVQANQATTGVQNKGVGLGLNFAELLSIRD